jgi:hypothetical protein
MFKNSGNMCHSGPIVHTSTPWYFWPLDWIGSCLIQLRIVNNFRILIFWFWKSDLRDRSCKSPKWTFSYSLRDRIGPRNCVCYWISVAVYTFDRIVQCHCNHACAASVLSFKPCQIPLQYGPPIQEGQPRKAQRPDGFPTCAIQQHTTRTRTMSS